jgi:hypothetical protein
LIIRLWWWFGGSGRNIPPHLIPNTEKSNKPGRFAAERKGKKMNKERSIYTNENTTGDAIVTGLYAGLLAGMVMLVYLVISGLVMGQPPLQMLSLFAPGKEGVPLLGGLMHLAVSGVYGSLYGLIRRAIPVRLRGRLPGWLSGALYGLLLFVMAELILLPGTGSPLLAIPAANFALAHIVFGVVLGSIAR